MNTRCTLNLELTNFYFMSAKTNSRPSVQQQLDPRLVTVDLEVNNRIKTFKDLAIRASGVKFANALQNECQITITNLDKQTQDYILSETSPFNLNRTPKTI